MESSCCRRDGRWMWTGRGLWMNPQTRQRRWYFRRQIKKDTYLKAIFNYCCPHWTRPLCGSENNTTAQAIDSNLLCPTCHRCTFKVVWSFSNILQVRLNIKCSNLSNLLEDFNIHRLHVSLPWKIPNSSFQVKIEWITWDETHYRDLHPFELAIPGETRRSSVKTMCELSEIFSRKQQMLTINLNWCEIVLMST